MTLKRAVNAILKREPDSLRVRARVTFDKWAWPLVRHWFHFEIDSEFLRGIAFCHKSNHMSYPDALDSGNGAAGRVKSITLSSTIPGVRINGVPYDSESVEGDGQR